MLVDRVHQNVVDDTRLPVPGLQATDASRRAARRLEQRVVHPRHLLEFPAEQALIELLHLLRFLDVELDVHNRSGFWSVCHDDTFGPVEAAGGFQDVGGGSRKVRELWRCPRSASLSVFVRYCEGCGDSPPRGSLTLAGLAPPLHPSLND